MTDPLVSMQTSTARLQESLARIQQQILANRADLLSMQQRIAQTPRAGALPPTTTRLGLNGRPAPVAQVPRPMFRWMQPGENREHGRAQNGGRTPPPTFVEPQPGWNTHITATNPPQQNIQRFQGPHGEQITSITNNPHATVRIPRPSSAPGQPPSRVPATAPPQAPLPPPPNIQLPTNVQLPANIQLPTSITGQTGPPPMHLPLPFGQNATTPLRQPSAPTVWLLSSPTGPQALVFAPGHGYFSTAQQLPLHRVASAQQSEPQQESVVAAEPQDLPPAQHNGPENVNADVAIARQGQRPRRPVLVQVQRNLNDDGVFAFLVQRGWLFMRLYLFLFVFSESGTWKRWIMILVAAIICLQPRDGPFTRAMTVARRHLDNLIGPTAPQPQLGQVARGQRPAGNQRDPPAGAAGNLTAQRPTNVRGAVPMTPEEAARRLTQGNQGQNRSVWRDAFFRVEQSAVLFLASLVPGVSERHVLAREEARRVAQQHEEERRRAEEETATHPPNSDEDQPPPGETGEVSAPIAETKSDNPGEPSTSSSVEVRATEGDGEAGELRNRST